MAEKGPPPKNFDAFASRLRTYWWRLLKETQNEIVNVLSGGTGFGPGSDAYASMLKILYYPNEDTMKRVYAILDAAPLLDIKQKRSMTVAHFIQNASFLTPVQIDLLAGIVSHMCPVEERYTQPGARIIGSAFAHGADVDAFQFFSDMLDETLRVNKILF